MLREVRHLMYVPTVRSTGETAHLEANIDGTGEVQETLKGVRVLSGSSCSGLRSPVVDCIR